ncbi:MAG: hypothetical protein WB816_10545 [Methylocystis sp.]
MATKSDFTADEWKTVLESPILAGFAISAADPSGFISTIKEGWAEATELATAKTSASDELIKAVADDLLTADGRSAARDGIKSLVTGSQLAEYKDKSLAELKRAVAIIDAKAPADAAAFKTWLGHIAQKVAEAGAEGGFLGFGGVQVSDKEKATIAEINTVLGV